MEYQEQYFIAAHDGVRLHAQNIVKIDPDNPKESERKARDIRCEFLVRYPYCEVEFQKELRTIRTSKGDFLITQDGKRAVYRDDERLSYEIPSGLKTDSQIRRFINDMPEF